MLYCTSIWFVSADLALTARYSSKEWYLSPIKIARPRTTRYVWKSLSHRRFHCHPRNGEQRFRQQGRQAASRWKNRNRTTSRRKMHGESKSDGRGCVEREEGAPTIEGGKQTSACWHLVAINPDSTFIRFYSNCARPGRVSDRSERTPAVHNAIKAYRFHSNI